MNGSQGIQPVVELAGANNNAYPYPAMYGNGGFGGYGSDFIWIILLFALFGGWGNNGNGGFFNGGFDNGYAWLSNGQKEIMQNTNNGFDTLHLSNQLDTVNSGIYSLSNQLCNTGNDITSAISNGFYNSEISANNRQMANMNTAFNLQSQLAQCCCDNKLATQDLKSTVISENCSDREVLRQIGQDILVNQTANTQKIIDEIFRDRLDEKDDKIAELNRQLQMADLKASQIAQTQAITSNIYNELKNCPVGTVPVYGNQPIFSCPNSGCGCGFNTTSQFI
jgi:hypothetical protein